MNKIAACFLFVCCWVKIAFAQADTVAPVLRCKPYEQLLIKPYFLCSVGLSPTDLIDTVWDNSGEPVLLSGRKACSGDGFPEGPPYLYYTINELGGQAADIWAKDKAGNTTFRRCHFFISDLGTCDPAFSVSTLTPDGRGIGNIRLESELTTCLTPHVYRKSFPFPSNGPVSGYYQRFGSWVNAVGYQGSVFVTKNTHPYNGVTTIDLALIQKYILGLDTLSTYGIIAADANQDGKVSTYDVVLLRKLLLGVVDTLPNNKSWRFIPKDYFFPNLKNPFEPPFPESIAIYPTTDPPLNKFEFIGIKIGDVNGTANPSQ